VLMFPSRRTLAWGAAMALRASMARRCPPTHVERARITWNLVIIGSVTKRSFIAFT
jgi:hypothetical protein